MIPTNEQLYTHLSPSHIQSVIVDHSHYFEVADKFILLQERFAPESLFDQVTLWIDMVIQPILSILQILFFQKPVDVFTLLTVQKTMTLWLDWFTWKDYQLKLREWISIVRAVGGPFISSNDAKYHMYVYADGMQRIYNCLHRRRVPKKRTKRL